jgi:hypothetical protein
VVVVASASAAAWVVGRLLEEWAVCLLVAWAMGWLLVAWAGCRLVEMAEDSRPALQVVGRL